jgi:hypothetical protein
MSGIASLFFFRFVYCLVVKFERGKLKKRKQNYYCLALDTHTHTAQWSKKKSTLVTTHCTTTRLAPVDTSRRIVSHHFVSLYYFLNVWNRSKLVTHTAWRVRFFEKKENKNKTVVSGVQNASKRCVCTHNRNKQDSWEQRFRPSVCPLTEWIESFLVQCVVGGSHTHTQEGQSAKSIREMNAI